MLRPSTTASPLAAVDTWIFDLDNTLYPASAKLFDQIDVRMKSFIQSLLGVAPDEARHVQKRYFYDHGTTLRGLMRLHDVDPHAFLDFVHDIDMSVLSPAPQLEAALMALPGRRLIFTNADAPYARRVLGRLGIAGCFEAIHDIHDCAYAPKPEMAAYDSLCAACDVAPDRAVFVEDMARNLVPAKAMGMATVWVNNGSERGGERADEDHIDIEIRDTQDWLIGLTASLGQEKRQ